MIPYMLFWVVRLFLILWCLNLNFNTLIFLQRLLGWSIVKLLYTFLFLDVTNTIILFMTSTTFLLFIYFGLHQLIFSFHLNKSTIRFFRVKWFNSLNREFWYFLFLFSFFRACFTDDRDVRDFRGYRAVLVQRRTLCPNWHLRKLCSLLFSC